MHALIQNTKTFQSLEKFKQQLAMKRTNRLKIEDAVVQARNLGVEQWEKQAGLPASYIKIVKEIVIINK